MTDYCFFLSCRISRNFFAPESNMADKSDMALTHLEELFDDLESEGSKHVSDFKAEMKEVKNLLIHINMYIT